MAINLPNFLAAKTGNYGPDYDNLLSSAMQGYEMSRKPAQMRTEEAKQKELVNQLLHRNKRAGIQNEYLPREKDIALALNQQKYDYNPRIWNSEISARDTLREGHELENALKRKYGQEQIEAQIRKLQQEAKYAHLNHLTANQRDVLGAIGSLESPEAREALRANIGLFSLPVDEEGKEIPLPRNARSMLGMTAEQKSFFTKRMDQDIARGENAKKANDALLEIIDISKRFPKLNRSVSYILAHPEDEKFLARAVKGLNEDEQTALDLMVKNSNTLALYQSETGSARATNLLRQMYKQMKPHAGMTTPAIMKLANQLIDYNKPLIAYADQAAPFVGTAYIPYQSKNYDDVAKNTEETKILKNAQTKSPGDLQNERIANAAKQITKMESEPGVSSAKLTVRLNGNDEFEIPLNQYSALKKKAQDNGWKLEEVL